MRRISTTIAVLVLTACAAAAQTLMPQAEVGVEFDGNTYDVVAQSGFTGVMTFNPDMTLAFTGEDGRSDTGTYRLGEGGYCSTWKAFRNGEEQCFTVEKLGDGRYQLYTLDGGKDDLFTLKQ